MIDSERNKLSKIVDLSIVFFSLIYIAVVNKTYVLEINDLRSGVKAKLATETRMI